MGFDFSPVVVFLLLGLLKRVLLSVLWSYKAGVYLYQLQA